MIDPSDNRDPAAPSPVSSAPAPDTGGDDDGGDDGGPDEGGAESSSGPGGAGPGQPMMGADPSRRRKRRRRRRGNPVLLNAEGQAYRMVAGPDGQPVPVFLTPHELQQHQQRQLQQQQQPPAHPPAAQHSHARHAPPGQHAGGQAASQAQLQPVEGVLDTDAKGPNAFLRQLKKNLLPSPDDAEMPKNMVQKLRQKAKLL